MTQDMEHAQTPGDIDTGALYWQAVQERDRTFDGRFVYGVVTTGVYCRPSCPSRRPLASNVRFFEAAEHAEAAGFRACRRCGGRATIERTSNR